MKVKYETLFSDNELTTVHEYRIVSAEFCCKDMKKAWNDYFIRFGKCEGDYCLSDYKRDGNYCNRVCIYKCNIYESDVVVYDLMPIKRCPFCGEEIIVEEVRQLKLVGVERVIPVTKTVYEEVLVKSNND